MPNKDELMHMKKEDLVKMARQQGIGGPTTKTKNQLVDMLSNKGGM